MLELKACAITTWLLYNIYNTFILILFVFFLHMYLYHVNLLPQDSLELELRMVVSWCVCRESNPSPLESSLLTTEGSL